MTTPAELSKRLCAPSLLLHAVCTGSGLQPRAPICPLSKGPSPSAMGSPGLDPRRAAGAPFSQGSDCSVRAAHRLWYQIPFPRHFMFSLCYPSSAGRWRGHGSATLPWFPGSWSPNFTTNERLCSERWGGPFWGFKYSSEDGRWVPTYHNWHHFL